MAIKVKPQGPRFKKFEIWTKMAKVPKPQGPKWQFTLKETNFETHVTHSSHLFFSFPTYLFYLIINN
ncbi:hypothetical protein Hanom_Chr09g00788301 [Helianthus anomalus]